MNAIWPPHIAASYAWCILQVTLFTTAAIAIYAVVKRRSPSRNVLLLVRQPGNRRDDDTGVSFALAALGPYRRPTRPACTSVTTNNGPRTPGRHARKTQRHA